MKEVLKLEGKVLRRLELFLINELNAKKVEALSNHVDEVFYTYKISKNHLEDEILIGIKEDELFGDTTTIKASGEILEQISHFMGYKS